MIDDEQNNFSIEDLQNFWSKESNLKNQIFFLIEYLFKSKELFFNLSELDFPIDELLANNILTNKEEHLNERPLKVKGGSCFFFALNRIINQESGESAVFSVLIIENTVREFESRVTGSSQPFGLYSLSRMFRIFLIIFSNKQDGNTFEKYILSSDIEKQLENRSFFEAYVSAMPYFQISSLVIFKILKYLSNPISQKLIHLNLVNQSLTKWSNRNSNQGKELFHLLLSIEATVAIKSFLVDILIGVTEIAPNFQEKLDELFLDTRYQSVVVSALSKVRIDDNELLDQWIIRIFANNNSDEEYQVNALYFYGSFANKFKDRGPVSLCFLAFQRSLCSGDKTIVTHVLQNLAWLDSIYLEQVNSLLLFLVNESPIELLLEINFDFFFSQQDILKSFFSFIFNYSKKITLNFRANRFRTSIVYLRRNNHSEFDKLLVSSLIANEGFYRFAGREIFQNVLNTGLVGFFFEILTLPPIEQYKLATAVLSDLFHPEQSIFFVSDLLKSSSGLVQEFVALKIEDCIKSFKKNLMTSLQKISGISDDYKNRFEDFYTAIISEATKKQQIKELNPYYTQYRFFSRFTHQFNEQMRMKVNAETQKTSMMQHIGTTIEVAKSGGWRNPATGIVEPLTTIEAAFPLPESYFIEPELNDFLVKISYNEDWGKIFDEIESLLNKENG